MPTLANKRNGTPLLYILNMRVSKTSYARASEIIRAWACQHATKYVCIASVNNAMEAHDSRDFPSAIPMDIVSSNSHAILKQENI
jgi:hypothetical protein